MNNYLEQIEEQNFAASKEVELTLNEQIIMEKTQNGIKLPNKLSNIVISELNDRLGDEYHAYFFYVNASNWCKDKNYDKAAAFFKGEADAELTHAQKVMDYLVDWNTKPSVPQVQTDYQYVNLLDIIQQAYDMEYGLLEKYNATSGKVFATNDFATFDFLSFFRETQIGEVSEYSDFLNALQLIDINNKLDVLYFEKEYFE